jgi:hypothetical protein
MKNIRVRAGAMGGLQRGVNHGHTSTIIQEVDTVLTNQCLEKERNAEPPGRGTIDWGQRSSIMHRYDPLMTGYFRPPTQVVSGIFLT